MRRIGIGLLAASVLALGIWLRATPERARETDLPPGRNRASETAEATAGLAEPMAGATADEPDRQAIEPVAATSAPPAPALELRVVEGASGAPVADALVFLVDWGLVTRSRELDGRTASIDGLLMRLAERCTSDRAGVARFPEPKGACTVAARAGTRFAHAELLPAEPGPVVLALEEDPPVRVRVVGADGKPVGGVPVALRTARRGHELVRVTTGGDGTAELFARQHRAVLRAEGARVGVASFQRAPVEAEVDLEEIPRAPIELRLPPCGSLEVVLEGVESPPGEPLRVWAELTARMEGLLDEEAARFGGDERWTRDGRARFAPLGLGLELRVGVEAQEREEHALVVDGPAVAGETRTVVLALGAREPVVVGRLVAPDGRPLGPGRLEVRGIAARESAGRECAVDAEGRFRCVRPLALVQRLELELVSPRERAGSAELQAPDLRADETDLGTIVLAPAPIVLRGRVRDEGGAPVRGASLGVFVQGENQYLFALQADARGRFESRKCLPGVTHLRLHVRSDDCQARWLDDVPVGDADVEIVLARGGWIRGRLEFTPNLFPTLRVTRDGAPVLADGSLSREGFRLGPLPAGRYALAARFPWSEAQVVIDGLDVRAGEVTSDPRLDPLDLRGLLPFVNLEVVDEEGAPVGAVAITWLKSEEEAMNLYARRVGDAWTVAVPLPAALRVEAAGFRARELKVAADQRVALARGIPLRFELDGAQFALPEGWSLEGELSETSPARRHRSRQRLAFTESAARAWASQAGPHELELLLVLRHAGKELVCTGLWNSATPFDVRAEGPPQLVRIAAPAPEEVARAIEENR